ncbi:MAG: GNAT family N-acetyltransferase [Boseongicola sp.]|nr:GNAT family N-acetyltransferase [Boseongicola sp.]
MSESALEISTLASLSAISPEDWDACASAKAAHGLRPVDPFTTHRFLNLLETSGSVGSGTGWLPRHLVVRDKDKVVAVAPLYVKGHSQGEYIFDHSWAHAWERAGGRYYPKLQIAVPFTPVTGRRFLVRPGCRAACFEALWNGALHVATENRLSSVHATFCVEDEAARGRELGLLHRVTQQYRWVNEGYEDFDGFLSALSSRKRKAIRRERRIAQSFGGEIVALTGDAILPGHWDAFWEFYQDTGARKWGRPYLTRAFFDQAREQLAEDILLILAIREGCPVAGAMNFVGRETIFGRYWGAIEYHDCLHFELCYYQAIDYAIANGLGAVEAGAQGDHKLARGYLPTETHSLHWVADSGFARAVEEYLEAERAAVDDDIEVLTSYGPFRKVKEEPE